ncbi:hypothetical protein DEU56DRAFT_791460 [Suillus clintonianus]|uniref:uncharacterized protein n=1 Tax=Suillus clintonianus TaxID=1904413 RepID=UPI001B86F88F|nr:uncharacterized protein DEU56DRAFT_791460 [Suillus clintonianus]KAG2143596.1 hypothetical protein DEU56DRAFT_791460 [Suillus clintonianus]
MNVFNPRILDASIRDVTGCLSDTQKADVLLHALQHLPPEGSRIVMENAVQSFLQVSGVPPADVARGLLLRAKTRLAAGYRTSAQQDLLSVLCSDPANQDVKAIIQSEHLRQEMLVREPDGPPRFSAEVWREIALCLPKRDLKSLLLVPHALSRIASQLIFREIDLHFTASPDLSRVENRYRGVHGGHEEQELDAWHYQRSADILTRILVDPVFALQVRSLSVYAVVSDASHTLAFQTGMLINSLPKLCNLRSAHCSGNKELITRMLETMCASNHRLYCLSINPVNRSGDIDIPPFKHITHFSISAEGGSGTSTHKFISQSHDNLRSLVIKNTNWTFPTDAISVRHLTTIEFEGCFSVDSQVFSEILSTGHQLESLTLSGILECTPSATFRMYRSSLPFLRHFALKIVSLHRHVTDRDLVPAISEFLRDRKHLHSFHLIMPSADHRRIGFDASAWGVLPSLSNLRSLCITYPRDLSPSLAGWLIPRSVRALTMEITVPPAEDLLVFMNQLRPGIPPLLTFVGMINFPIRSVISVIEHGFSNVQIVRIDESVWSVIRLDDGSIEIEQWPYRRIKFHAAAWLESLRCEDAMRHLA